MEEIDLFDHHELIPNNLKKILLNHWEKFGEDGDYNSTVLLLKQVEDIGYTFDYYLDNVPYNLREKK